MKSQNYFNLMQKQIYFCKGTTCYVAKIKLFVTEKIYFQKPWVYPHGFLIIFKIAYNLTFYQWNDYFLTIKWFFMTPSSKPLEKHCSVLSVSTHNSHPNTSTHVKHSSWQIVGVMTQQCLYDFKANAQLNLKYTRRLEAVYNWFF